VEGVLAKSFCKTAGSTLKAEKSLTKKEIRDGNEGKKGRFGVRCRLI